MTNWSGGALPGPADDVTINPAVSVTVTHASGGDSIHSLNSQVPLVISGGSLGVASNSVINSAVEVQQTGDLEFNGSVTSTGGSFVVDGGGGLVFAGSVALDSASSISGAGSVLFQFGSATVAGTYNVTGSTVLRAETADFSGNVPSVGSSLTVGSQGPTTVDFHDSPLNVSNLTLQGSAVLTSGPIQTTNFNWFTGTLQGTGSVTVAANGNLALGGYPGETLDGRSLDNYGMAKLTDLSGSVGSIDLINGAVWNNELGATFTIETSNYFFQDTSKSNGTFNNAGSLLVTSPTGAGAEFDCTFNNTGVVQIDSGNLAFTSGYHQTGASANTILNGGGISSSTPLDIQDGQITGSGTITGSVTSSGNV
jgi:hypothetical protein